MGFWWIFAHLLGFLVVLHRSVEFPGGSLNIHGLLGGSLDTHWVFWWLFEDLLSFLVDLWSSVGFLVDLSTSLGFSMVLQRSVEFLVDI